MAIIGISGRIGNGKDTVAAIIQKLTAKVYTKSDEFGDPIRSSHGYEVEYKNTWEVKKFSYKLKLVTQILTGVPMEKFEDQIFKAQLMGPEWNNNDGSQTTYRSFLQRLGTDAARDHLHTNVWVNGLFADYKSSGDSYCQCKRCRCDDKQNWIVTDVRFPNEFEAVKKHGGHVIRVIRGSQLPSEGLHVSETALDNHNFDYWIDNNGTPEQLKQEVESMLIDLGYL